MTTAQPVENRSHRIYHIDNLRIFLTALVIAHHSAIGFGAPGGWYYVLPGSRDALTLVVFTMFVAVNQAFFMSLFFFVSAYFTPASCDKKGIRRFLQDRFKRLGIPLLVYFFFLNASVIYLRRLFMGETELNYFTFLSRHLLDCTGTGPLWFVLSLLIFAIVYVALRTIAGAANVPGSPKKLPANRAILAFIVGIGVLTYLVRLRFPAGWAWMGLQFGYFPLYIALFVFGIFSYRHGWVKQLTEKQASLWFRIALVLIAVLPAIMLLGGALEDGGDRFSGGFSWQALVYACWEPFLCVGISMKLIVLFRNRFNKTNRLVRTLSKSAYTAYILHPFFVVVGTYYAGKLPIPWLAMFAVMYPLATASCFAVSSVIRKAPLLRSIL